MHLAEPQSAEEEEKKEKKEKKVKAEVEVEEKTGTRSMLPKYKSNF